MALFVTGFVIFISVMKFDPLHTDFLQSHNSSIKWPSQQVVNMHKIVPESSV